MEIKFTLEQVESLLTEQKKLVIERLLSHSYSYNSESTEGNLKSLIIDADKFRNHGLAARFPPDIEVLKKYVSEE